MNLFSEKIKEVFFSILPITLIVTLLNFTRVPLGLNLMGKFLFGTVFILFGLTFFLVGVDLAVSPLGSLLSFTIAKKNKIWVLIFAAFILGFIISIAEPGLMIFGSQISEITSSAISSFELLVVVSLGIGVFMILGFFRLIYNIPLQLILILSYVLVLVLGFYVEPEFLAIAFDSSGSTTGVLAVPFILALSLGISNIKKDSKASEKDSFGLVSIVSAGAVISVMLLSLIKKNVYFGEIIIEETKIGVGVFRAFLQAVPSSFGESFIVFAPLLVIFALMCFLSGVRREDIKRMTLGFVYSLIGLGLFLIGVNTGFLQVGRLIGGSLVSIGSNGFLIVTAFVLGVVTILAEPAVYVLTHQIEEVTSGYVKRPTVLVALSIGVGLAVALSIVRVLVSEIMLWHYLLPGYIIAFALTFYAPKLFVGIAFDAGGVATGPMTATFILAFINGAANNHETANILIDGFGMIAMVALMPIITLLMLGSLFKIKTRKRGLENE